jgi:membrane protein implicated in regulation of membrane protease activity
MALDKYEKVALVFVTIGISYLSLLLLGWQAVSIILCIAAGILYVLGSQWMKLRQRGTSQSIQESFH